MTPSHNDPGYYRIRLTDHKGSSCVVLRETDVPGGILQALNRIVTDQGHLALPATIVIDSTDAPSVEWGSP